MGEVAKEDTLGHLMKPVNTVKSNDSILVAAKLMIEHDVGAVVVVDGNSPVGVITERDITKHVVRAEGKLNTPVKQLMTKPLITANPEMSVQQAFELMLRNKIRRLPIMDGKKLVGIVSEKDLMRWVLKVSYEPNIPPNIKTILEAT